VYVTTVTYALLGVFVRSWVAKKRLLRTIVICVYRSVCPSACASQAPTERIFAKFDIGGWGLRKPVEKLQILLKVEKIGYFSGRPRHFDNFDRRAKYFVPRKPGRGAHCDISKATLNTFLLLTATCTSTTIRKEHIVGFLWRLWLGKHAIVLSYTYIAYLVY